MASERALTQAIAALRGGDRLAARTILQELTSAEPQRAEFWLWLAASSADKDEKRAHLLQAFALTPDDRRVVAGLRAIGEQIPERSELDAARPLATETDEVAAQPETAAVVPSKPMSRTRFATTGVRNRQPFPWLRIALVCVVALLIPLTVWLI